ncbi:hypothetical protein Pfo_003185 [Paulownia fortunei]|nr:hypothetical protein Pfo_003185 [Paulownia fortunei]
MGTQSCAENNNGEVDHHGRSPSHECQENVQIVTPQEFSQLLESQPRKWHPGSERRRQIHKVPPQIRLRVGQHVYDPELVSLGPYHHGKPELRRAEEFKYFCLDFCAGGNEEKKAFLYNKVLEKISIIRDCYAEVTIVEKYDDKALALMMLLDACFIINFMWNCIFKERINSLDWLHYLGMAASSTFTTHDVLLLENQIPFQVLKLLISLVYDEEGNAEDFLQLYLSSALTRDLNHVRIPRENEEPPIHLLESVFMDLKAKGIHIRPSSSRSLMDITFKSGQLQLPVRYVSDLTQIFFSNMIAYEVSPNSTIKPAVLSYAIFMKSLIQSPEDVKELQEKGILLNTFANYEQVVKVFKEIDTFGYRNLDIFEDVRRRVEDHCRSRAKTWIADLIHTRFRSPWTAIALFAAAFLLCLTFLQTFFTIRPEK